jgi:hypothetical protein
MSYATWTDADWERLLKRVRSTAPTPLSAGEIRQAAYNYMHGGADGGGNKWGLIGTHIAMCVDEIESERG